MSDSPLLVISVIIIALLLFVGICDFFYLDITGLGRRKAFREFPATAQKFGFILIHDLNLSFVKVTLF